MCAVRLVLEASDGGSSGTAGSAETSWSPTCAPAAPPNLTAYSSCTAGAAAMR